MLATATAGCREIFARMRTASLLLACALGAGSTFAAAAKVPAEIKIATWNLEWFMKPETLRALTPACTPRDAPRDGARRGIPCDVAHETARSNEDIAALRRYARDLRADVVALQEVDGVDAARLVFPNHEFCFSGRVAVQNNGFAIRRGIPFACGADVADLSLADDVRRGVDLRLFPGTPNEIALLSVHLKSGCAREPLDSTRPSCRELRRQVPFLEAWIDARAAERKPFVVLGDFNRDLRQEPAGLSLWADLDDAEPPAADLVNTAEGQKFENCSPAQTFTGYIDYIVLGRDLARGLVKDSFGRALYRPRDAARRKLSDHCPVFIRLRVADTVVATP
jgi:endonuclease/exonuclease/phosphatase family metal-dependent hydrolase